MPSLWKRLKNLWYWSERTPPVPLWKKQENGGRTSDVYPTKMAQIIKRRDPVKEVLKNE